MRAVPPLIAIVKDPDAKVRANAAEALGNFPNEHAQSAKPLLALLSDDNVDVRRAAILALGKVGKGDKAITDTVRTYTDDPDPLTKTAAAVALAGMVKMEEADVPALFGALNSQNSVIAKAATRALGAYGRDNPDKILPGLTEYLDKKEQPGFGNALRALRQMKEGAHSLAPKLAAAYDSMDAVSKADIADSLVLMDPEGQYAIPVLLKALKEPEALDRKEALMNLMRYRPKVELFLDGIIERLDDPDLDNKLLAIGIIRGLGKKASAAAPKLMELTKNPDVRVRIPAISALGSLDTTPQVFETFERTIKDPDFRVRTATISALKNAGAADPKRAMDILEHALNSEKHESAVRSLDSTLESLKHPKPAR